MIPLGHAQRHIQDIVTGQSMQTIRQVVNISEAAYNPVRGNDSIRCESSSHDKTICNVERSNEGNEGINAGMTQANAGGRAQKSELKRWSNSCFSRTFRLIFCLDLHISTNRNRLGGRVYSLTTVEYRASDKSSVLPGFLSQAAH